MEAITYVDGTWLEGNPPLLGPMDQSFFLGSMVFDGSRAFDSRAPDLDLHCARAIESARKLGMEPRETADDLIDIALTACAKFPPATPLYIRPTFYATTGFMSADRGKPDG